MGRQPDARTALAARREQDGTQPKPLGKQIQEMRAQFQVAMPRGMEATMLIRDAMTAIRRTPKLAECEPATILGGLMTCAQLGLRVSTPLGQAWILPFWNKRTNQREAQLIVGYQGYVELVHRSGRGDSLQAREVRAADVFEFEYGLNDALRHVPGDGDRGEARAFYAIVKYKGGGYTFDVMSRAEVERHRDRFAMTRTPDGKIFGPWVEHFERMACKTVLRRTLNLAPKSTELAQMITADGSVRYDVDPMIPVTDADVINGEVVGDPASDPDVAVDLDRHVSEPETGQPEPPAGDWPETAKPGGKS